jgi:hypothetical protein
MECEVCSIALKCARGFFKGCPYELTFEPKEDVLKEVEYQVINDLQELDVDFTLF